jgi:CheY-like chemotaxis protein
LIGVLVEDGPTLEAILSACRRNGCEMQRLTHAGLATASADLSALICHAEDVRAVAATACKRIAVARFGDPSASRLEQTGAVGHILPWPVTAGDADRALAWAASTIPHETEIAGKQKRYLTNAPRQFPGLRVLAADDNAVNREVLVEALSRLSVAVVCVEDGAAAVAAVEQEMFDLVFMDASMPVLDGFAATRAIREAEQVTGRTPLPIVALTAHVVGRQADEWRRAGMTDCLTKPFTLSAIESCLARMVSTDRSSDITGSDAVPNHAGANRHLPIPLDLDVLRSMAELAGPADNLVERIVHLFQQQAPDAICKLREAAAAGDIRAVAATAHALKSMCSTVGALELAALLHNIEGAAMTALCCPDADALHSIECAYERVLTSMLPFSKAARSRDARCSLTAL